jgi:hypothetical protein
MGHWAQSPIPNPQSPIPNPQSPFLNKFRLIYFKFKINKIMDINMDKIDMEDSSWIDNLIKEHQKSKNILNNINTFKFRAKRVK